MARKTTRRRRACGYDYKDFSWNIFRQAHSLLIIIHNIPGGWSVGINGNGFRSIPACTDITAALTKEPKRSTTITAQVRKRLRQCWCIIMDPQKQKNQRSGSLLNGICIPVMPHCDWGPYHGRRLVMMKQSFTANECKGTVPRWVQRWYLDEWRCTRCRCRSSIYT